VLGHPLQMSPKVTCVVPPLVGVLRQTSCDKPFEIRCDKGLNALKSCWLRLQYGCRHGRERFSCKCAATRQHFVEHRAKREDVAARVSLSTFQLLGRHVVHRPQHHAVAGQRAGDLCGRDGLDYMRHSRDAEVEQLRPGLRKHHVGGLQIAMHDTCAMRRVERARDVDGDRKDLIDGQRALLQSLGERVSVEELHDEIVDAVVVADVEQRADVGVTQFRNRAGFAFEPRTALRILREVLAQHLDGNGAIKPRVARFVDLAHPAGAKRRDDFVRTKPGSDLQRHLSGGADSATTPTPNK
jgi:hypothetical protein